MLPEQLDERARDRDAVLVHHRDQQLRPSSPWKSPSAITVMTRIGISSGRERAAVAQEDAEVLAEDGQHGRTRTDRQSLDSFPVSSRKTSSRVTGVTRVRRMPWPRPDRPVDPWQRVLRPRREDADLVADRLHLLHAVDASTGATVSGASRRRSSITSAALECARSSRKSPARNDLPVVHDGDAVAEVLGLFQIVRRVEDRRAPRAQLPHRVEDVRPRLRIDRDGGLVEQHESRTAHQRATQVEPPPHAAGVVDTRSSLRPSARWSRALPSRVGGVRRAARRTARRRRRGSPPP